MRMICVVLSLVVGQMTLADSLDNPNLHLVDQGLYRSGRPSDQGLLYMKNTLHIKTVIDLEENMDAVNQEGIEVKRLGMQFVSMPMSALRAPVDSEVNQIENMVKDKSLYPLLIHCLRGMDRSGLIIGLYRVENDQWSPQKAYNEMLQYGFHPVFFDLVKYFKAKTHMN